MIGPAFFVAGQFSRCNSSADMLYVRPVDFVDKLTEFSARERDLILGGNAQRLLKL